MSDQANDLGNPSTEAATLLHAGTVVRARVHAAIGARTEAISEACLGLGVLIYCLGIVLGSPGEDGAGIVPGVQSSAPVGLGSAVVLLVPFITASYLYNGVQRQLRTDDLQPQRSRFVATATSVLPVIFTTVLVVVAPAIPPLAALLLAVGSSAPLAVVAIRSALRARQAGVRRPARYAGAQLSLPSRMLTVALGIGMGAVGALGGLPYPTVGFFVVMSFLVAIGVTVHTAWGLPRLAVEWGRSQWTAFGCSYVATMVLAVMLPRITWNVTVVSIIGGIVVAAPLVFAAFRPAPIWEV